MAKNWIKACVYDNPGTLDREMWVDGELFETVSIQEITELHPFRDPLPRWDPGRLIGDWTALPESVRQDYHRWRTQSRNQGAKKWLHQRAG